MTTDAPGVRKYFFGAGGSGRRPVSPPTPPSSAGAGVGGKDPTRCSRTIVGQGVLRGGVKRAKGGGLGSQKVSISYFGGARCGGGNRGSSKVVFSTFP